MAKRGVLNQRFNSIFDDNSFDEDDEGVSTLKLTDIEPNKSQPRKNFDITALNTLADSIRQNGVIQPLLVRSMPDGTYQIVAGERRWRAAKMAGLTEVPVLVKELTDLQAQQIALIENLQRENLNPIEEANGYKELMDKFGMTQEEVARVVGKARSSIANSLERMVKALDKKEKPEKKKDTFYTEAEISLAKALETNVSIIPGKKKSTIQIEFYSDEDLTDIINRLANSK